MLEPVSLLPPVLNNKFLFPCIIGTDEYWNIFLFCKLISFEIDFKRNQLGLIRIYEYVPSLVELATPLLMKIRAYGSKPLRIAIMKLRGVSTKLYFI